MSGRLVAIVGPTAIGKSALALKLAQEFGGEIISADSRQVYRHMDIGTAKPTAEEQACVPHHLINIVNPDQPFSLAEYQALAFQAINDIQTRRHLPLLVGGTGQYVWALLENWAIPRVAPDEELRRNLEARAEQGRAEELHEELKQRDAAAAARIDRRNVRRVIRALENKLRRRPCALQAATPF
jgi:tRNA dimethylallyltransferase